MDREDKNLNNESHSKECEVGEDSTKYGEFISSYFAWIPLPEQKENTKRLENIAKDRKSKKKED